MKRNIKQILFIFTLFIIQHALTTTNIIQSEYFIVLGRHLLLIEIPELNEMLYKTINQQKNRAIRDTYALQTVKACTRIFHTSTNFADFQPEATYFPN